MKLPSASSRGTAATSLLVAAARGEAQRPHSPEPDLIVSILGFYLGGTTYGLSFS